MLHESNNIRFGVTKTRGFEASGFSLNLLRNTIMGHFIRITGSGDPFIVVYIYVSASAAVLSQYLNRISIRSFPQDNSQHK